MEPELFHIWEFANRPGGALLILAIVGGIVALVPLAYLVYRKRLHTLVLWAILSLGSFGFSQSFPENRNQRTSLALMAAISSAVLTWVIVREKRSERRKRSNSSDTNSN